MAKENARRPTIHEHLETQRGTTTTASSSQTSSGPTPCPTHPTTAQHLTADSWHPSSPSTSCTARSPAAPHRCGLRALRACARARRRARLRLPCPQAPSWRAPMGEIFGRARGRGLPQIRAVTVAVSLSP